MLEIMQSTLTVVKSLEMQIWKHLELVITVGQPGSGKSTVAAQLQKAGYSACVSDLFKSDKTVSAFDISQ